MPGSTTVFPPTSGEEVAPNPQQNMMDTRQPPPVAPRTTSISLQPWQPAAVPDEGSYTDDRYARSASTDSLESSGSSSSGGGGVNNRIADVGPLEYIPTRTVGKAPKLPSHNPLQFVKVQSPLYIKAEQQIKLTKEVKITREALKEGEEEWQSNLDNWKSRRRKVSEKVIQRAEEMRQIEIEEQLRQEKLLQQQRKIKKFSEIVEKKSARSYNLDLYMGQGDDSGLGGTPEPDDILDGQSSILRSDTSEGMTSEAESVDSDIHKSEKISVKDPPKVPQKPYSRLKKIASIYDDIEPNSNELFHHHLSKQDLLISDNNSSTDPSDIEGHAADTEATSSEEDGTFSGQIGNTDSGLESSCDNRGGIADSASDLSQDSSTGLEKNSEEQHQDLLSDVITEDKRIPPTSAEKIVDASCQSFKICIKHGDTKGFGFTLKGGKDQGCLAFIESVSKGGPADEIGLKVRDKIISLNGEYASDYSHASLIFSIKQAIYTGILDIVISREESHGDANTQVKTKETKKGNSFAEKLALFSTTGVNVPGSNLDESKSNANFAEAKQESLVLRRRSAFENGKAENHSNNDGINRRSSCVSHIASASTEKKLEKRHSVDLTLSQNTTHENNFSRKGPPPPVPVKPKIKSKAALFEINKPSSSKVNGKTDNVLSPSENIINGSKNVSSESQNEHQTFSDNLNISEIDKCHLPSQEIESSNQSSPTAADKMDIGFNILPGKSNPNKYINQMVNDDISHENQTTLSCDVQVHNCTNFEVTESCLTMEDVPGIKIDRTDYHANDYSNENEALFEFKDETSDSFCDKNENPEHGTSDAFVKDSYELELGVKTYSDITYEDGKDISPETTSLHFDEQSATECAIDYANYIDSDNCVGGGILKKNISDTESSFITSACHLTCDTDEMNESSVTVGKDIEVTDELEPIETKNIQENFSPLCLSLEKIDEDDVISASTTTSSGTPDTETVIETLPSNLSPLPNDESNGEDSSKLLSCLIEESEQPAEMVATIEESSSETNSENIIQSYVQNENIDKELEFSEDNLEQEYDVFDPINDNVIEESFYDDQQDDEYARELDESLDQITSLDIIDRIEQSLMDQLQQDSAYEDIGSNLNTELENDVSNPWLYFSEESELLDDLTPRNLEPPREPPPPPPPPEVEKNDNEVMTLGRTNSTKRIKKEIWRRRSDFLGIDSTEVIDDDNIPPPPPGLEELLKQEREQTQWLERQLSLPDPEVEIPDTAESTCLDSGNYSNNDYSEYYVEDDVESSKENITDTEQWGENIDEEALFENTYGLQYDSVQENVSAVIDESNTKSNESPQHKAKQNIQNLGAAPKAKIMDSAKWITEKVETVNKKTIEPVLRQTSYNQNYWLAQDGERRRSLQHIDSISDRRYSMPPAYSNPHPDVTVRTWGDREYEYQQHRPRSAIYERSANGGNTFGQKDLQRTQSLNSQREGNIETDTLESEVHKCSCCGKGLCEGSAMGIEALQLYFHIECFRCCVCLMQLGNGSCGTDVQVKNNQLYCPACFTVD